MKTEIICILDRSGSMSSMLTETIGGFNSFISEQQKVKGKAKVTLVQFDNVYEVLYAGVKLKDVPLLDTNTFKPRGMTALLDAIGKTLTEQKARIETEKWADKVIVVILTDGHENASQEFSTANVKHLTQVAQTEGWSFIYLGANQDAIEAAQKFGIDTKSVLNMVSGYAATGDGMRGATRLYSNSVATMRTSVV